MSVLIKGMEMPSGCLSCDFCNPFTDEPYCRRLMRRTPKVTRLKDCPLVPVADAVEVVRCKDCKHYRKIDNGGICVVLAREEKMTDDWYCADGERKEINSR